MLTQEKFATESAFGRLTHIMYEKFTQNLISEADANSLLNFHFFTGGKASDGTKIIYFLIWNLFIHNEHI